MAQQNANTNDSLIGGFPVADPMMKRYLELQVAEMEQRQAERERLAQEQAKLDQAKKASMLREAHDNEQKRRNVEASQKQCPHMQGNLSLVRGQRLGYGKNHIFCQFCLKTWTDWNEVPPHLMSSPEYFGGPVGF